MIITRFAPSPTGFLHIGGVRTALFNWLYARNNSGKFLLRIEDTDRERSSNEAIEKIVDGLKWLGLENDGEVVYQHKNEKRHIEVAHMLLESGFAYRDWELEDDFGNLEKAHAIRFKIPDDEETIVNDKVQGDVVIQNKEIEDFVLLRSNGTPTYMLSVVVDDYDMNISDIIRGDDHLTNAAKQKLIYDSLKWDCPTFSHIPLIHGQDGSKLSKRHGSLGIEYYKEEGYLPEAIINYLLRLGWSHGDQEIFSLEEMINYFSIEKIRKSPSKFENFFCQNTEQNRTRKKVCSFIPGVHTYKLWLFLPSVGFAPHRLLHTTCTYPCPHPKVKSLKLCNNGRFSVFRISLRLVT